MILAQNLRLLLNGSKILLLGLIFVSISSCGIFQSLSENSKSKERDKSEDVMIGKVDTIQFEKIPDDEIAPIRVELPEKENEDNFVLEKRAKYKIALFVPFNAEEIQNSKDEIELDDRFLNYYAGIKLALTDLAKKGQQFEVYTFDSERSENTVKNIILSEKLNEMDLIIGPYEREGLSLTSEYGKSNNIPVVSPWLASTRVTDQNPYYLQLRPSLSSHYFKIAEHVWQNFNRENIYLIGRQMTRDTNRFTFFQRSFKALETSELSKPLQEYLVLEDSINYGDTAFDGLFEREEKIALILPNWSYNDEDFIYGCLRKLNIEKGQQEVYVYGMPILYDSEKIDFDYYKNLNIRIVLSEFIDWEDDKVKEFEKKYYSDFQALPTKDALEAYDMMTFIGNNMLEYGINFFEKLEEDQTRYLQTAFDIQSVYSEDGIEKKENLKYLENKHLDLIQFIEDRFQKID